MLWSPPRKKACHMSNICKGFSLTFIDITSSASHLSNCKSSLLTPPKLSSKSLLSNTKPLSNSSLSKTKLSSKSLSPNLKSPPRSPTPKEFSYSSSSSSSYTNVAKSSPRSKAKHSNTVSYRSTASDATKQLQPPTTQRVTMSVIAKEKRCSRFIPSEISSNHGGALSSNCSFVLGWGLDKSSQDKIFYYF